MSQDSYMYSTYGLASAIVLYVLKKLHQSQCIMRDGTIQIKLSSLSSRSLPNISKTKHANQADTKTAHRREDEDTPVEICIDDSGEAKSSETCT